MAQISRNTIAGCVFKLGLFGRFVWVCNDEVKRKASLLQSLIRVHVSFTSPVYGHVQNASVYSKRAQLKSSIRHRRGKGATPLGEPGSGSRTKTLILIKFAEEYS